MITHKELLKTPEYWTTHIQLDLYAHIKKYMKDNGLNRTQLAQKLGVTKGYITQVLSGNFNHRLSKLVELSLAIGLVPKIQFIPENEFSPNTKLKIPIHQEKSSETRGNNKFKMEKELQTEHHFRKKQTKEKREKTYC